MNTTATVRVGAHLAALLHAHALDGAACAGHYPRWDLDPLPGEGRVARSERLTHAATVCESSCPARAACGALVQRHTTGVVQAGARCGV